MPEARRKGEMSSPFRGRAETNPLCIKKEPRRVPTIKQALNYRTKKKEYGQFCSYSFSHALSARYSVLHLIGVLSSRKDFLVICLAQLGVIFLLRKSDIAPAGRSDNLFAAFFQRA